MVEGARLESVYTLTGYRGFESLSLRQRLTIVSSSALGARSPNSGQARGGMIERFGVLRAGTYHVTSSPESMGACVGPPATIRCKPRQARKGAAVAADLGAGVWLARVAAIFCPPLMRGTAALYLQPTVRPRQETR